MIDFYAYLKDASTSSRLGVSVSADSIKELARIQCDRFLESRINWVIDGIMRVYSILLNGDLNIVDYLKIEYPTDGKINTVNRTGDQRRSLLFRIRFLLRCMKIAVQKDAPLNLGKISDLEEVMQIFLVAVKESAGDQYAKRLRKSFKRFIRLWDVTNPLRKNNDKFIEEIDNLIDDVDATFEFLREGFSHKVAAVQKRDDETLALKTLVAEKIKDRKNYEHAVAAIERSAKLTDESDDPYSRMAGLSRMKGAKLIMLKKCIEYSHRSFPIVRGESAGDHSITALVAKVWRLNQKEFDVYAKLKVDPGYKNIQSLAGKFYKLTAKYPEADYFAYA